MASAAIQPSTGHGSALAQKPAVPVSEKPHHVQTTLNFFKENEDGSPPSPNYVNKPESYDRPTVSLPVTVHDVSGHELDYTLDSQGFQFYYHESAEKEFLDDEKIKRDYYPETEQLLKDAYVIYIYICRSPYLDILKSKLTTPERAHPKSSSSTTQSAARAATNAQINSGAQFSACTSTNPTPHPRTGSATISPPKPQSSFREDTR